MTKLVAFDESGNTGADLLNIDQPTFVLASCDFTEAEAKELIGAVTSRQTNEAKFSRLRRSESGRNRLSTFLADIRLVGNRAKVFYSHKKYMAVTKIIDLLVENLAYRDGLHLYKDGANIALSNVHFYCTPAFCGEALFTRMLESFVLMFRRRDVSGRLSNASTSACGSCMQIAKIVTIEKCSLRYSRVARLSLMF